MAENINIFEEQMQAASTKTDDIFRENFISLDFLPKSLSALDRISENFYWCWQPDGPELFRDLDAHLWAECEQNPRLLLSKIDRLLLIQRAADPVYIARVTSFAERMAEYLSQTPTYGGQVTPDRPAAYFCAEYGVHNSLPNYSGGLGILAGDHLKSASDLSLPLVAVGLLYRFGYFRQVIGHDGWQNEKYADVFRSELAVESVDDERGEALTISVSVRGRDVTARVWRANIGRVTLYLLDTNVPENSEVDRLITGHLYGGDSETRIVQEMILGIGGARLLKRLNIEPAVYHLNEGHSAFLTLELARVFLAANSDAQFDEAIAEVRNSCVFTTHTPVDAGNDTFEPQVLLKCFGTSYIDSLKIDAGRFLALGRTRPSDENEYFGMTPFAIRMCRSANGVSEKHGAVSRKLWRKMFGEASSDGEVPISYVTNGVHAPTWVAPVFAELFRKSLGTSWRESLGDKKAWRSAVNSIDDQEIWTAHRALKNLLIEFVRARTGSADTGARETINEHTDTSQLLSGDFLTIGFARRVAAYKRWELITSDLDRLLKIVNNLARPVQFVFAGKAHPQDRTAKQILQNLMSINHDSSWQQRAVFIADYDQEIARHLVQGVDVWLNVPRRPLEASGTSGMKAAMNGVLNFSVLDGWWMEGYDGENGYAIGGDGEDQTSAEADKADADAFYSALENIVIPDFYDKNSAGFSPNWIRKMKNSIATLTPAFSSDRMVGEYVEKIYNR